MPVDGPTAIQMIATPVSIFNCPTRRTGGPYPGGLHGYTNFGGVTAGNMAKTDYASNTGDSNDDQMGGGGPGSLAAGDDKPPRPIRGEAAGDCGERRLDERPGSLAAQPALYFRDTFGRCSRRDQNGSIVE